MNDATDGRVREARILDVLRDRPEWPAAVERLRQLYAQGGAAAQKAAAEYGQKYAGQRGAMVVDVVASRQRTYSSRVRAFEVPAGEHAILVVARAAAAELGVDVRP